ncbi:EndoU domain-containing protein [Fusibacter ferrireducens]|uniref:EndoU domain-containing protein n=1 Tax=Fusibacter ferrireducens TaxID=2785058 RepID=A0ABR9ZXK9_9FIRM|nr:EndoU domain-containing protein [Fusibacter ferrireducens]MBF4695203.1 EndoU domain-containing protein [Fusibacter ferrireducens]
MTMSYADIVKGKKTDTPKTDSSPTGVKASTGEAPKTLAPSPGYKPGATTKEAATTAPKPTTTPTVTMSSDRETHIMDGDGTGGGHLNTPEHQSNGKSLFPVDWDRDKAKKNILAVANSSSSTRVPGRKVKGVQRYEVTGTQDGVNIMVIVGGDEIVTAYPL